MSALNVGILLNTFYKVHACQQIKRVTSTTLMFWQVDVAWFCRHFGGIILPMFDSEFFEGFYEIWAIISNSCHDVWMAQIKSSMYFGNQVLNPFRRMDPWKSATGQSSLFPFEIFAQPVARVTQEATMRCRPNICSSAEIFIIGNLPLDNAHHVPVSFL